MEKRIFALLPLVIFACLCSARQAAAAENSQPKAQIIDMHCHTAGVGYGGSGCFLSKSLQESFKFKIYLKSFGVTLEQVRQQGDGLIIKIIAERIAASRHVNGAVILAMDGVIASDGTLDRAATEMYTPNEFVRDEVKKYDSLSYGASVNPSRSDAIQRLRQASADGAVLIKWLPSIMMIDPADERHAPFYREMARLGIPLLTHTGDEASFTTARNEYADPARLELPLKLGVTVIAAHMASSGSTQGEPNMDRLIALMNRYSNLYADISALTQANRLGALERALGQTALRDRLLYGTDYPLTNTILCTPWAHLFSLGFKEAWRISRAENSWDRDVELKRALGVPPEVFALPAKLLIKKP